MPSALASIDAGCGAADDQPHAIASAVSPGVAAVDVFIDRKTCIAQTVMIHIHPG